MNKRIITIITTVLLTSCFNAINNKDSSMNHSPVGFHICNQTLSTKFIEGYCTKAYNYRLNDKRICSECPNVRFNLTKDSLIYNVYIDSLSKLDFNSFLKYYKSVYGEPYEERDSTHLFLSWDLHKEKLNMQLIKTRAEEKGRADNYGLVITDLDIW